MITNKNFISLFGQSQSFEGLEDLVRSVKIGIVKSLFQILPLISYLLFFIFRVFGTRIHTKIRRSNTVLV